jgi:hypothetical protein
MLSQPSLNNYNGVTGVEFRAGPLIVSQFGQPIFLNPEGMGDLVDHRDLDFFLQFFDGLTRLLKDFLEKKDSVRKGLRGGDGPIHEGYTPEDAQERLIRGKAQILQQFRGGPLLHGNEDIIQMLPDLLGDPGNGPLDDPVELLVTESFPFSVRHDRSIGCAGGATHHSPPADPFRLMA